MRSPASTASSSVIVAPSAMRSATSSAPSTSRNVVKTFTRLAIRFNPQSCEKRVGEAQDPGSHSPHVRSAARRTEDRDRGEAPERLCKKSVQMLLARCRERFARVPRASSYRPRAIRYCESSDLREYGYASGRVEAMTFCKQIG